ncbi:TPA: tRNA dihydrouridine(20/20a) synthase DusA, partial [Burkholderia cenocepacia]
MPSGLYPNSMSVPSSLPPRRVSVAPMLDWTDRHCRSFHRTL